MAQMQLTTAQVAALESRLAALESQPTTALARGHVHGLTLSNHSTIPLTSITVSVGQCRDRDDTMDMVLSAPISKSINGTFATGTGSNGLDTGTKAASTGYHIYLIYNPTTTDYDVLISASALNPTLPSGYTKYRRLGAVMTNSATEIRPFYQYLNYFNFKPAGRLMDINAVTNAGPTAYLRQIGVPQGKKFLTTLLVLTTGTASAHMTGVFDPDHGVPTMSASTDYGQLRRMNGTGNNTESGLVQQWTDANRQVYTASSDTADVISLMVIGWIDDLSQMD